MSLKISQNEEVLIKSFYISKEEIDYYMNLVHELQKEEIFLADSINKNLWIFPHVHSPGRLIRIDFSKINLKLEADTNLLLKCWILSLLEKYKPYTCASYFHYLAEHINKTNFFSDKKVQVFSTWIGNSDISNNTKKSTLTAIINFFDFSNVLDSNKYLKIIESANKDIQFSRNQIELPSSKNILLFSYYLEKYFEDIKNDSFLSSDMKYRKKILFLPIKIWWDLTSIIPMRSTEFCILKRDSCIKKDDKFFILIDRIKLKNNKESNTTKIEITEDIYSLIDSYIQETEKYGLSNTLISYRSLIPSDPYTQREKQKKNLNYFNANNLQKLLKRFYSEVIESYYNIHVPEKQKLTPNDTRHIAFISLMMQGIPPIEIARIGGHSTISAQYHYSFHTEYWIDCEVFNLLKNYKSSSTKDNHKLYSIPNNIKIKALEPPTSDFKGELEFGYCSDSLVRCEATECMLCTHWRINYDDLIRNSEEILNNINKTKSNITELMNFIYSLRTNAEFNLNTEFKSEDNISRALKKVNSEIVNLFELTKLQKGENSVYGY